MRKLSVLLILSAFVVLCLASVANANTTSTYATWDAAGPNAGTGSPHQNYQLATVKCAVCHAVHKAPTDGEVLLRSTVTNACVYCHIQTSIGNLQIYNADTNWYNNDETRNHSATADCVNCHAVHGASIITTGNITSKVLKAAPTYSGNPYSPQSGTGWSLTGAHDEVISAFCSACHPYFVASYEDTHAGSFDVGTFDGHLMTAAIPGAYGGQGTYTGQAAYAADPYCRSCHDDGATDETPGGTTADNFPHYTTGVRFMNAATSTVGATSAATQADMDGVCLKCHRDNTNGVGTDF